MVTEERVELFRKTHVGCRPALWRIDADVIMEVGADDLAVDADGFKDAAGFDGFGLGIEVGRAGDGVGQVDATALIDNDVEFDAEEVVGDALALLACALDGRKAGGDRIVFGVDGYPGADDGDALRRREVDGR